MESSIPGAAAAAHGGEIRNGTVAAAVGYTHVVMLRQSEAPNVGTVSAEQPGGERRGEVDAVVVVVLDVRPWNSCSVIAAARLCNYWTKAVGGVIPS